MDVQVFAESDPEHPSATRVPDTRSLEHLTRGGNDEKVLDSERAGPITGDRHAGSAAGSGQQQGAKEYRHWPGRRGGVRAAAGEDYDRSGPWRRCRLRLQAIQG